MIELKPRPAILSRPSSLAGRPRTPALKWHLIDHLRIELAYGYGKLDRFDLEGTTQFFQGRFITAL